MQTPAPVNSETAIWARIIDPQKNGLSHEAAASLLQLTFSEWDRLRMNELAEKNQKGELNDQERQELAGYVKVGDVLSLMHLKAKRSLKR